MEELRVSFGRDVPRGKEVLSMAVEVVKAAPGDAPSDLLKEVVQSLVELVEADLHLQDSGTSTGRL